MASNGWYMNTVTIAYHTTADPCYIACSSLKQDIHKFNDTFAIVFETAMSNSEIELPCWEVTPSLLQVVRLSLTYSRISLIRNSLDQDFTSNHQQF